MLPSCRTRGRGTRISIVGKPSAQIASHSTNLENLVATDLEKITLHCVLLDSCMQNNANINPFSVNVLNKSSRTLRVGVFEGNKDKPGKHTKICLNNELHHCTKLRAHTNCAELGNEPTRNSINRKILNCAVTGYVEVLPMYSAHQVNKRISD